MRWYDYAVCILTAYNMTIALFTGDLLYLIITYLSFLFYSGYRREVNEI
tara:strand:- start:71 stop:217 length:147 start_codon:yes stop_codon:yes gene_type:complete